MAEDRMRIAYVHDSPLHGAIQTVYDDPIHLQKLGFTDAVVADQMTGCLHSVNEALISPALRLRYSASSMITWALVHEIGSLLVGIVIIGSFIFRRA
mgnify:CR=1 FL=1